MMCARVVACFVPPTTAAKTGLPSLPPASPTHLPLRYPRPAPPPPQIHLIHVIPPGQRMVLSPDLGIEGVVEEDEATRKKVVSGM